MYDNSIKLAPDAFYLNNDEARVISLTYPLPEGGVLLCGKSISVLE